jgi:predicted chitinase
MKGDEPIQVNIFLRGANRRRYVTDDMIQALSQGLISQTGQLVSNPFDASTALEEAMDQGTRWTGDEPYRQLVELDLEEGWREKAAAGALALGALGAQGDAEAKYKETWIQPRQQAAQSTMAPAAKFDSTKIKAKTPIAKAPAAPKAKVPIAKAPAAPKAKVSTAGATDVEPSAMNMLSLNNPEYEELLHRTAKAAGLKGTELAQFMAQTRHESADFSRMKELGGDKYFNKLYDPKVSPKTAKILGNTRIGDGIRYHGRGFIQITGRDNYRMAGAALRLPLEQRPELASNPAIAAKIAVWYWKTRVKPSVDNFNDTTAVTKKINPALRGLADRVSHFKDYKNVLNIG